MSFRAGLVLLVFGIVGSGGSASAAVIADLAADWSNTSNPNNTNPNGTWDYRQGTSDLPLVSSWNAGGTVGFTQPAWAPSNTPGNFLPAEFKTQTTQSTDWQVGDVVAHTVDSTNGNPSLGVANYLFTSAVAGTFDITGDVWDARHISRPQGWELLVNSVDLASGSLDGNVNRSSPNTFDLTNLVFAVGTTVELEEFRTGIAGDFVGSNLTISTSTPQVPEPGTLALLGVACVGFGVLRHRRAA